MDFIQLMATCPEGLEPIARFLKHGVIPIFQIGIPIILIVMGTVDLGKAVISSDDKEIKAGTTRLIKRAIAAVAVFFVATIVTLVMGMFKSTGNGDKISDGEQSPNWSDCWDNV